jgi:hypothetical protein
VFYILPRPWTEKTLPINLSPAPKELVRVMVGRAEMIRPETQEHVRGLIGQFASGTLEGKAEAVHGFRKLSLGRFADPAIRLALGNEASQELNNAAWALLAESRKQGRNLARK